ncbi:MAG: Transglutaminase Domain-Containing Protein, partial [Bacteroidetes bacterium]|nr:Transglutaminase Domain-Containing Protein [Bacteroidota bacterium]
TKELTIRALEVETKTYGMLKTSILPSGYYDQHGMVICFLEPDREPTKHLMNELPDYKTKFDKWGGKFIFVVPSAKLNKNFTPDKYKNLPKNSTFILNNGEKIMDEFLKSANQSFRDNYPLIYIVDSKGQIIFYSEGYRIGVGDLIGKTIKTYYK